MDKNFINLSATFINMITAYYEDRYADYLEISKNYNSVFGISNGDSFTFNPYDGRDIFTGTTTFFNVLYDLFIAEKNEDICKICSDYIEVINRDYQEMLPEYEKDLTIDLRDTLVDALNIFTNETDLNKISDCKEISDLLNEICNNYWESCVRKMNQETMYINNMLMNKINGRQDGMGDSESEPIDEEETKRLVYKRQFANNEFFHFSFNLSSFVSAIKF